jgi:hypothetical protein
MPTHTHFRLRGALRRCVLATLLLTSVSALPAAAHVDRPAPFHVEAAYEVDTDEGRAPRPKWELFPTVEATFLRESYRPGSVAKLVLWHAERNVTLRIYHSGPENEETVGNVTMKGVPVSAPLRLGRRAAHAPISVPVGDWASGLYFAQLTAPDGRVGFAPFVVRPQRLGEHRVLVVLPTYTWQAYNFRDDDHDGKGDTWYGNWNRHQADIARPFLARGVPPHFWHYDHPFLQWLAHTNRAVDFMADSDLQAVRGGDQLADAYDLIVFPGHHEYVTKAEFDNVERYRDLGGNLMFLSANNFFWKVTFRGNTMTRVAKWRDLGRPEAALVGVGFIGTDEGVHRGPWTVRDESSAGWIFDGMKLDRGMPFGNAGIEIDHTSSASPRGIRVLAEIPHLFGPRFTAQMTYYENTAGAKVFAAGAFTLAGSIGQPAVGRLVENLWSGLSKP